MEKWRLEQSEERTRQRRPELYEAYSRTDRAVSYLSKDRLSHMDMLEVIRRGQADVIRAEESGVLLHDRPSGAWMLSASDEDMGERLLSEIPREEKDLLFLVHQDFLRDSIARRFHRNLVNECIQAVYTIGRDGEYLVFFEVKYRKNADAGLPAEAVGTPKQRRICRTAKYYLYRKHYGESVPVRFDVVAVCAERVNWYQNAFDYMR